MSVCVCAFWASMAVWLLFNEYPWRALWCMLGLRLCSPLIQNLARSGPAPLNKYMILRYMMFIFCVKAALLANRAFVARFASWDKVIVTVYHVLDKAQLAVILHTVHWCRKSQCCRWSLSQRCRLFGNLV